MTEVQTNEHTNGRTDKRKDENYLPLGINAGGININFTLDRYKVFRRRICTEPGSEQVGLVLVLGAEVVQVGPIQMFGLKQNYSSKHLDRTSTGPGSEQLRRLNSLFDCY